MRQVATIARRDVALALRQPGDTALALMFFFLAVVLFPFGVGPEPAVLARIAAGVVWVTALFAAMLPLDRLFQADYEDGGLDLLLLAPAAPWEIALAKAVAHWLTTGLPILVAAPVFALMLNLEADGHGALLASMALGTPTVSLIGTLGAALTVGARRGGVLLALLVLPLLIPVLIFGAAAVEAAVSGLPVGPHLALMGALLLAALALCPFAAGAALKQVVE